MQLRVRALETILTEKGYVDPAALDQIVENVETKISPHIGARVVARAWVEGRYFPPFLDARKSSEKALIAD
jgi:nitrile hydratase